jgi:tRNA modification GTPase
MIDTICAIATPLGTGSIGVVRVSGPLAADIATTICGCFTLRRGVYFRPFLSGTGEIIDQGIALYFPKPQSFTGEDVLELQGHGGRIVMDLLLTRVLELGARLARPGEFSERAFINGKLDLLQAEAIADLISSDTAAAARAASRSLQGEFSRQVDIIVESLIDLRMCIEAAIDFPEDVDLLTDGTILTRLAELQIRLKALQDTAGKGKLLRDGMTVVIVGKPNVGKSSLLNHLARFEAAIVTDIPGTTRDVLREHISINGIPLHLVDTAGLHESDDQIECEGIRRAWLEIGASDLILMMVDNRVGWTAQESVLIEKFPVGIPVTIIYNKIDLNDQNPSIFDDEYGTKILISIKTGAGLDLLHEHLKTRIGYQGGWDGEFIARRRHLAALKRAAEFVALGLKQLNVFHSIELAAEELREAQNSLMEITGKFTSEELLSRVFSTFCIGK